MSLLWGGLSEQIEPDWEIAVAGVEVDGLLGTVGRDVIEQLLGQIAVRVDQTHSVALQDELQNEIAQESGLARAGFTDDVGVVAGIRHLKTERHLAAPRLPHADVKVIVHAHAWRQAAQASRRSIN